MYKGLLATSVGILLVSYLPELPPWYWLVVLAVAAISCLYFCRVFSSLRNVWWVLGGGLLGVIWGIGYGYYLKSVQLPPDLEGQTFIVTGTVTGLPRDDQLKQRFTLRVETALTDQRQVLLAEAFPQQLLLSWYKSPTVTPGERWQLKVKLKRPRGFVNPAGFDYQAWLLRQGLGATGYVRHSDINQRLGTPGGELIARARMSLQQWLSGPDNQQPVGKSTVSATNVSANDHLSRLNGLLIALLIGERSQISTAQWQLLQQTGTNHLIAISGLHIGLVAGIGYWLGKGVGACFNLMFPRITAVLVGSLVSLLLAWFYAALAGFSLPTRRALIMVALVQLALLARRTPTSPYHLALALLAVLLFDPLAGLDLGFWLSFAAVGWLLYAFVGRIDKTTSRNRGIHPESVAIRLSHNREAKFARLRDFTSAQLVVAVGLLLPSLLLVNGVSLIAPLANLVAIPLVTILVVPPLLFAASLFLLFGATGGAVELALKTSQWAVNSLWRWLQWLQSTTGEGVWYPDTGMSPIYLVVGLFAAALLLMPRGIPGRWLGGVGLLVALFPQHHTQAPLTLTFLDVGQGLALVVEARAKTLVYDTGPSYSDRFNAGAGIIAPYLKQQGIHHIDTLVVSHGDGDHAGGLRGLLTEIPVSRLLMGEPRRTPLHRYGENCHRAAPWEWQGVFFEVLSIPSGSRKENLQTGNNRSCVLYIRYGSVQILLPGDIEAEMERELLQFHPWLSRVDLLVAPHHGSITSSTEAFIKRLVPVYVVYSTSFNGRYGHPHKTVATRYQAAGAQAFNTALDGAIQFRWYSQQALQVKRWREQGKRYWMNW